MSLAVRLKKVREELRYTQKEMAKAVSVSVQMWQAYEAGRSVPGGNVLESLARLGFNVNWLLTGEGFRLLGGSGEWWSERIKELRGNLTIPEFVEQFKLDDPERLISTIQAIEDKKMDADFSLMHLLSCRLGISADWMLGVLGAPKMITDRDTGSINTALLRDVIREAELFESINPGSLSQDKKAELMAQLYAMRAVKGK